MKNFRVKS